MRIASCLAIALAFGCKREAPQTVEAAAVATEQPKPPAKPPLEAEYGDKYLVILSSSTEPGVTPPSVAVLESKKELGATIARLDSSRFENLMPCYEIVVARAFDRLADAREWSKALAALGIDHYVKNAGKYVGRQPAIEAHCKAKREATPNECGGLMFVEKWEEDLFVPLGGGADRPEGLAPLDGNRAVWRAKLEDEIHGAHRAGDVMIVLDTEGEEMRCKISGFSVLVRGHPHFGYFQNADGLPLTEPPKNDAPGCGDPEVFAELSCPGLIAGQVALAVAHDRPLPARYRFADEEQKTHPLSDSAIAALRKTSAHRTALEEATEEAANKGAPLEQDFRFREASAGDRKILIVRAIMFTGEGQTECGGEDVRVEVEGAFELTDGAVGSIVLPFQRVESRRLSAVLDLERDGVLERFDYSPPSQFSIHRSDGTQACELVVPFCDCGC